MTLDKETRNALARMVGACRKRLAADVEDQLRGAYGLHPEESIPLEKLGHLSEEGRVQAGALRELMAHFQASQPGKDQSLRRPAYDRMVLEISFTTLNRLAALRLCEERGLVIECVRQGMASDGFRIFDQLSGGALGTRYESYRIFLQLMFDELAVDLGVLFDRTAPQSAIFPSERCLEEVLALLNDAALRGIWTEDETIGWIYQYFNPPEERKAMRDASQAPRNSRELAVRNQFFTPRYVVEFLTDNTLGRTWYEMRQGDTRLKDECRYLVRRYDEVFLSPLTAPNADGWVDEGAAAAARLLLEGDERTFTPFSAEDPDIIGRLIRLGHCVLGYFRHSSDDSPEGIYPWCQQILRRISAQGFDEISTRDLLDLMFLGSRAQGGVHSDTKRFISIAEEIRRRVLRSHEIDLSTEEQLRQPVVIPFRAPKDPRDLKILDPACGSGHFLLYAFDLLETIYQEHWETTEADGHGTEPRFTGTGTTLRSDFDTLEHLRGAVPGLILRHNLHGIDIDPRAVQIAALALWLRAQRTYQKQGLKAAERPQIEKTNIVCAEPMPGEREMLEEFLRGEHLAIAALVRTVWEKMELAGEAGSLLKIEQELADAIEAARKEWLDEPVFGQMTLFAPGELSQQRELNYGELKSEEFWDRAEERVLKSLREYAGRATNGHAMQRRLFRDDAEQGFAFIDLCRRRFDVVLMNPPFGDPTIGTRVGLEAWYPLAYHDMAAAFVERAATMCVCAATIGCISTRTIFFLTSSSAWRDQVLLGRTIPLLFADFGLGVMDAAMVEASAYTLKVQSGSGSAVFLRASSPTFFNARIAELGRAANGCPTLPSQIFCVGKSDLYSIPGAPFAYWCSSRVRALFGNLRSFEDESTVLRQTNPTTDDFRFLRDWREVPPNRIGVQCGFVPFAKGGESRSFYYDVSLVADWDPSVPTYRGYQGTNHRPDLRPASADYFFKAGVMWPLRAPRLCAQAFPEGTAFSARSFCLFAAKSQLPYYLALLNSSIIDYLFKLVLGRFNYPEFITGALRKLPKPNSTPNQERELGSLGRQAAILTRECDTNDEASHSFVHPFSSQPGGRTLEEIHRSAGEAHHKRLTAIWELRRDIDKYCLALYGVDECELEHVAALERLEVAGAPRDSVEEPVSALESVGCTLGRILSWCVGAVAGRWDVRLATGEHPVAALPDPFEPLPFWPQGALLGRDGHPAVQGPAEYPIRVLWRGVLVDDAGLGESKKIHQDDIVRRVRDVLTLLWGDRAAAIEQEACDILGIQDLREYFSNSSRFFDDHLKRYSKSRRKAPIYWPLSTASGSYTIWVYYHRLTDQTLYAIVNDYVEPKMGEVERWIGRLVERQQAASGREAAQIGDRLQEARTLLAELNDFRAELLRVAALPYKPDLNDGVIINAAPLHRLFRHRGWARDTAETWSKLERGEYDWAHLALNVWPERVKQVCRKDRSIAIAHGLEGLYEAPPAKEKPKRRGTAPTGL